MCKRLIYDGIDKSSMYKTVIVRSLKQELHSNHEQNTNDYNNDRYGMFEKKQYEHGIVYIQTSNSLP